MASRNGKATGGDDDQRSWRESPSIWVPLVVAFIGVVGGVLAAGINSCGSGKQVAAPVAPPKSVPELPTAPTTPTAPAKGESTNPGRGGASSASGLEVIDAVPINKPLAGGARAKYDARDVAAVDLKLKNPGGEISVVNRARLTITRYAPLTVDGCLGGAGEGEGNLRVTGTYVAKLPLRVQPPQTVDVTLDQQVLPNRADRLKIGLALNDPGGVVFSNGHGTGASRLYELRIQLFHDRVKDPLSAGPVVVAVPFPWYGLFVRGPSSAGNGRCVSRNRATLQRFLAAAGARSQELTDFASDPRAAACSARDADYCR